VRGGNLGQTRLKRRRRSGDPMQVFDRLPPDLRRWMTEAALPWSPASCLALWRRALAEHGSADAAIDRLRRAEAALLSRERADEID
jgi:hypothetical protein